MLTDKAARKINVRRENEFSVRTAWQQFPRVFISGRESFVSIRGGVGLFMLNGAGLLRVEKTLSFIHNSDGQHVLLYPSN